MNSEGAWVLCVFAADELGNEQDVTNATKTRQLFYLRNGSCS